MRKKRIAALIVASICCGCEILPNCNSGPIKEGPASLTLKLVLNRQDLEVRYHALNAFENKVFSYDSPALGDTVVLTLYGEEQYHRNRLQLTVTVDSSKVFLGNSESDTLHVSYLRPTESISVVKKLACSPTESGMRLDSVVIEKAPGKRITFEAE